MTANRDGALGELYIDDNLVNKDEIGGTNRFLRTTSPIYIGGIDPDIKDVIKDNKVDVRLFHKYFKQKSVKYVCFEEGMLGILLLQTKNSCRLAGSHLPQTLN